MHLVWVRCQPERSEWSRFAKLTLSPQGKGAKRPGSGQYRAETKRSLLLRTSGLIVYISEVASKLPSAVRSTRQRIPALRVTPTRQNFQALRLEFQNTASACSRGGPCGRVRAPVDHEREESKKCDTSRISWP